MASELRDDLLFKLGDAAYERLWNKPNAPRSVERVIKAAEALEQRQIELKEAEEAMDAEQAAYEEFKAACEEEGAQCDEAIERFKKPVALAEAKAKALEAKLVTSRKDAKVARMSLEKFEAQLKTWEEEGLVEKAKASRLNLKSAKLDVMKKDRACDDMQTEYDKIMNPESGPGAEGIRARRRQKDLELQLDERTEAYNARIQELNDLAGTKDEEVRAAKEYYNEALFLLGEEVYKLRVADPALAAFYPKLDKVR
jgi:hypothetical protein